MSALTPCRENHPYGISEKVVEISNAIIEPPFSAFTLLGRCLPVLQTIVIFLRNG
jgi:hypothetical protein